MPFDLEKLNKARELGYDDDKIVSSIERNDPELSEKIQSARSKGFSNSQILSSYERRMKNPDVKPLYNNEKNSTAIGNTKSIDKETEGYWEALKKGARYSFNGELLNLEDTKPEEIAQDPEFWKGFVQEVGSFSSDLPYYVAGASLGTFIGGAAGSTLGPFGTAAGGILGGGAGALALPEFLKQSVKEYKDYVEKGHDLTFGEFLQRADKVASKTLNSGLMGATLGIVAKAVPLLKDIPYIGQMFATKIGKQVTQSTGQKIAEKVAAPVLETATLGTVPALSERRLPNELDYASAAALVLGFQVAKLPAKIVNKLRSAGEASGKTPEEFAKTPEAKEIINEIPEKSSEEKQIPVEQSKTETDQKTETPKADVASQNINDAFAQMGGGISENFYKMAWEKISNGEKTNDPFIESARKNYESGAIKNFDDLKRFSEHYYLSKKSNVNPLYIEPVKPENQSAKEIQSNQKKEIKSLEENTVSKEETAIQKRIDSLEKKLEKANKSGNKKNIGLLKSNLEKQKQNLKQAIETRKNSVPQTPEAVNTKDPTLDLMTKDNVTNPNVLEAVAEKPIETLSKGVFVPTGIRPGKQKITSAIRKVKTKIREASKWVMGKAGYEVLKANPESAIYKSGWRAIEDYMSTKMGLKERFFTRWRDSIGKNTKITKSDREDMIFYRERTGNPFIQGDTFEALSKRMSPESKHVVDTIVDAHMKETLRLINESPFMQGKEVVPREIVEDIYIRHFYSGKISTSKIDAIFESMQKKFNTDNPFKNQRTFLTFDQALREAGLVPKYRDIVQNLAAQDGMLVRVLSNNELIANLHEIEKSSGSKMIVRSNNKKSYDKAKQDGWIQFQDPYLRTYVAGENKNGKLIWSQTEAPALVHPDLAPSIRGVFRTEAYKPDNA